MQSHYITASRHCITPSHYTTALRHRITPLRHNTRSTRSTAYTVGRRYKPISFHNRAMRHSRATLLPQNVPQQFCAAPLGNALPLFRRWRVRIDPVSNKLGDTFSTLGHCLHPWATLQAYIVPQQFCATPSGNTLSLFRRRNIRIDPVMNKPGDTFGNAYTLGRHYKPISFHNRAARHPWATLQAHIVPQQSRAAPSGDVTAPKRSPTVLRDTLGQHFATFSSLESSH